MNKLRIVCEARDKDAVLNAPFKEEVHNVGSHDGKEQVTKWDLIDLLYMYQNRYYERTNYRLQEYKETTKMVSVERTVTEWVDVH